MWTRRSEKETSGQVCTTDDCLGNPIWRMDHGGIASNYCTRCRDKIDDEIDAANERADNGRNTGGKNYR